MTEDFYRAYDRAFGRHLTDAPIQVLTWRLRASYPPPALQIRYSAKRAGGTRSALKGRRKAYFPEEGRFVETPVYERYDLTPGGDFPGPAIIEERECTTIVGFRSRFSVDGRLNLIIARE
jgi:N-methylhydantoinase A